MPILGTIASQVPGRLNTNSYESIATTTVGSGGVNSVTFSSISSSYKHLQLRVSWSENATNWITLSFNNDTTGANYKSHELRGNGSTAASYVPSFSYGVAASLSNAENGNTAAVIDILDYQNTNKNKVTRSLSGQDSNGAGIISLISGLWINTAAITTLKILAESSETIKEYSSFALYGIKG
jgi:hypothetical protein